MSKLEVSRSKWNLLRPYSVDGRPFYNIFRACSLGDKNLWTIKPEVNDFLTSLSPAGFLGFKWAAASFYISDWAHFSIVARNGRLETWSPPPRVYFARKSDLMLMKLSGTIK